MKTRHFFVKSLRTVGITISAVEFLLCLILPLTTSAQFSILQVVTNALMSAVLYGPISHGLRPFFRQLTHGYHQNRSMAFSRIFSTSLCSFFRLFFLNKFLSDNFPPIFNMLLTGILATAILDNLILFSVVVRSTVRSEKHRDEYQFFLVDGLQLLASNPSRIPAPAA
uniref:GtrA-like protein domain-containing protein n=1 Tax=Panagrolaimus sp. JU765 TaxID=591449 RepID=A0AC34QXT1_9BILA